jgi:hypothetical protein
LDNSQDKEQDMFENLNVGDNIAVVTTHISNSVAIDIISKVTPTQIHVGEGKLSMKFSRKDGASIGYKSTYNRKYIVPLSSHVVLDFFAHKIAGLVKLDLQRHDSSLSGRDGVLRSLKDMRNQLDKAIDLIEDDERLIGFAVSY